MVKVSDHIPREADGQLDVAAWMRQLRESGHNDDQKLIAKAIEYVAGLPRRGDEFLEKGLQLANLVISLNLDDECVAAAIVYRPMRTGFCGVPDVDSAVSPAVGQLVSAVVRMADSSLLEMSNAPMQSSEARDQVENIRRMLVSMIDDARVAILKLAERIVALRAAKGRSEERRRRVAEEALLIFAPLANRLGVWHLKWELEDLALRYLDPDVYMALAKQLDGRRVEREAQVAEIASSVESKLQARGIEATVHGRAKHIFSIWRKMRSKNVGLDGVYDQRAIRILVPDIGQCYSTLGVIHTEWQHIPTEFDDYIAVPKENGYRSIHTAVIGDDGKTLEVQIRTPEMHEEAELGVCAHWAYKDERAEDVPYTEKMNWLRSVVEWHEETRKRRGLQDGLDASLSGAIGEELRNRVREERIFVYTPKGHVLDLTTGATPVDFAYRVHTEVGHRCREARVDGKLVALNTPLETGQRVEIISAERHEPERRWLDADLGFVRTARAREKIQNWFRDRDDATNQRDGGLMLSRFLDMLLVPAPPEVDLDQTAIRLGFADAGQLYKALAVGDCQLVQVVSELPGMRAVPAQMRLLPDEVAGPSELFTIAVGGENREGLLHDITSFLKTEHVSLVSNTGRVNAETRMAAITLEVDLESVVRLAVVINGLQQIPGVVDVRRIQTT